MNSKNKKLKIALIGLGPYAKKTYIRFLKKHKIEISLIIELESRRNDVSEYLHENNIKADCIYLEDKFRCAECLPVSFEATLDCAVETNQLTHMIISTEPRSRIGYLKYVLKRKIKTLIDKPVFAFDDVSNSPSQAEKLVTEFERMFSKYCSDSLVPIEVQTQRRYHKGYRLVKKLIDSVIAEYGVPVTYIDIYHSSGMWNMPDEFFTRENHPYKYGYGELLHSGYHFFDLFAWLLQSKHYLDKFIPDNIEIYSTHANPNDFLNVIPADFYSRFFKENNLNSIFANHNEQPLNLKNMGELDFSSIVQVKSAGKLITSGNINLIQNSYSGRSWSKLPEDTYKANGRVRHERLNIHMGPLMNIQVHSYRANDNKAENKKSCEIGGANHFDIIVFRNVGIIGGEQFVKYNSKDIASLEEDGKHSKANTDLNDCARERQLLRFFDMNHSDLCSNVLSHRLTNKLIANAYKTICLMKGGHKAKISFSI